MQKLAAVIIIALSVSACAQTSGGVSRTMMDWGNMGSAKVAKVTNLKSLEMPGVY